MSLNHPCVPLRFTPFHLLVLGLMLCALLPRLSWADTCQYLPSPPDAQRVAGSADIKYAWYGEATTRYPHGVLGDRIEAGTLYVQPRGVQRCALSLSLETDAVFEDVSPRIADVTGDGRDNVIAIVSTVTAGASLVVYGIRDNRLVRIAATPPIGTPFRWLAPIGTADFDGDGILDVAYVRTPHLAGILKVWRFAQGEPTLLASQAGFSNHRIGENFNTGGIRTCNGMPRIVIPDRAWRRTMVVAVSNGQILAEMAADNTAVGTIAKLMRCS